MPADTLLFAEFLSLLRSKGVPISVTQYQEFARLCVVFGCNYAPQSFGRGLASLFGRSAEEVTLIEDLFFHYYADAFDFPEYKGDIPRGVRQAIIQKTINNSHQSTHTARKIQKKFRRIGILISVVLFIIIVNVVFFFSARVIELQGHQLARYSFNKPALNTRNIESSILEIPNPSIARAPKLPVIPIDRHWGIRLLYLLPPGIGAFALLYWRRRRAQISEYSRRFWNQAREELSGPTFPQLLLPNLAVSLDREDLDDMATLLGRSDERSRTRQIDGEATVRATLQYGALPSLIWKERGTARPVLTLCDTASDMEVWRPKIRAFCEGLQRRGVPLDVRYFDGDASQVSRHQFGSYEPLEALARQFPGAALLVLSTGSATEDPERPREFAPWVELLRRFRLRAWLNPVTPRRLWRRALRRPDFPARVLPMTRMGFLAAAYELAFEVGRRRHISDAQVEPTRTATTQEVENLRQIISTLPDAPIELAAYLRFRFYPDMPEDALALLVASSEDLSGQTIHWSDDTLAKLLRDLRAGEDAIPPSNDAKTMSEESF